VLNDSCQPPTTAHELLHKVNASIENCILIKYGAQVALSFAMEWVAPAQPLHTTVGGFVFHKLE
jgi:hypothetical protein